MKKSSILVSGIVMAAMVNAQNTVKINECVISNAVLKMIEVDYDPATGNKTVTVNNVKTPFEKAYNNKKDYSEGAAWYVNSENVKLSGQTYMKYGLPRILGVNELQKSAVYKGINVYVEAGIKGIAEVIYIPVRQGCEFQPYQRQLPECGNVTIKSSVKEVKAGNEVSFTASVAGKKQQWNYSWTTYPMSMIKEGGNNQTVIVSTKTSDAGQSISVMLDVKGEGCQSYKETYIKVVQ